MMFSAEASQRSPMISTAETFRGLQATCNALMQFERELDKRNHLTIAEFNHVVGMLGNRPLQLALPKRRRKLQSPLETTPQQRPRSRRRKKTAAFRPRPRVTRPKKTTRRAVTWAATRAR